MDDIKGLIWVVMLVLYFIYNIYKRAKGNKEEQTEYQPQPAQTRDQATTNSTKPAASKPGKSLEEIFNEVFGEESAPKPVSNKPTYESIEYDSPPLDVVPSEKKLGALKRSEIEAFSKKDTVRSKKKKMPFSPREAFKYKELLDRKYKD